jgi:hypothetical protein
VDEVARFRELEAFRTMSASFVHDRKNAAASLNLMLQNLPVHFDDRRFLRTPRAVLAMRRSGLTRGPARWPLRGNGRSSNS